MDESMSVSVSLQAALPVLSRARAPPPLDLRFMCVPYNPSWDVLRRMCESERRARMKEQPRSVEAVLDMGSFDDNDECSDDDDDESRALALGAAYKMGTSQRLPRQLAMFAFCCVLLLLAVAFRVRIPRAPFRFVRDKV